MNNSLDFYTYLFYTYLFDIKIKCKNIVKFKIYNNTIIQNK